MGKIIVLILVIIFGLPIVGFCLMIITGGIMELYSSVVSNRNES
jgi:hypothetical protein